MRTLIGVGTPRGLQDRLAAVVAMIIAVTAQIVGRWRTIIGPAVEIERRFRPNYHLELLPTSVSAEGF